VIFAGVGVLILVRVFFDSLVHEILKVCQAAQDVISSLDDLIDLFESIENFFKRLESYTKVPLTEAMACIIVDIMVEVLNILALATKSMKEGRKSAFFPGDNNCRLIYFRKISQEDYEKQVEQRLGTRKMR
jgi:hypothetical protein